MFHAVRKADLLVRCDDRRRVPAGSSELGLAWAAPEPALRFRKRAGLLAHAGRHSRVQDSVRRRLLAGFPGPAPGRGPDRQRRADVFRRLSACHSNNDRLFQARTREHLVACRLRHNSCPARARHRQDRLFLERLLLRQGVRHPVGHAHGGRGPAPGAAL